MSWPILLYRLLLPAYVLAAFPGWLWKMGRRGGFGTGLSERLGLYRGDAEFEHAGAVHVHAVSVGETLLALKLIRAWRERDPERQIVLAVATATGHAVGVEGAPEGVRVVYQPIDFRICVDRYLSRFEPAAVMLVEGEMWPNLMLRCEASGIPVSLVNARMSPRSRRRFRKFASLVRPVFSRLDRVALQEEADAALWEVLGVPSEKVRCTGSLKFDSTGAALPQQRPEFAEMIRVCSGGREVVLAASTHAGEEELVAAAVREAGAFPLIVPRHAERRWEVTQALEKAGFKVVLRSAFAPPEVNEDVVLVVDSTGELRDWTAHADAVVIGKSFLGVGGQSPAEAVLAGVPVVFGPHMENFEPLATQMSDSGGVIRVPETGDLSEGIRRALVGNVAPDKARGCLQAHQGAAARTLDWVEEGLPDCCR
ncbi:3-deoxy-D-manno-octulosonic acid transferase [Haloferula helveola]|uniref:3-deoxy-D-manno-octulosonic acid transferase n=1 Tax=Haloferula helveola TaxID=490095 RepID=A0ABM7RGS4_9BACT|nr:3-deoxy-D-manno-octulosonic acid transferase [Haloferula helveola]